MTDTQYDEVGLYAAMRTLRAVRRLRPDPVPAPVLERVLEAASWAPTGGNVQPWRVIAVSDRDLVRRLGDLYSDRWLAYSKQHMAQRLGRALELRAKTARMLDAGNYLAEHFADTPVVLVFCFNPKIMAITDLKQGRVSVVGGASIYPAVENALLACRAGSRCAPARPRSTCRYSWLQGESQRSRNASFATGRREIGPWPRRSG